MIRDRIVSANAYIGAFPLVEALATGAQVVIAGRSTDTALTLAPMVHRFGWGPDDFDKLAAGTIAGHIINAARNRAAGIARWTGNRFPIWRTWGTRSWRRSLTGHLPLPSMRRPGGA